MTSVEKPPVLVLPTSLVWNISHACAFAVVSAGAWGFDRKAWPLTMLLVIPLAIGTVQVLLFGSVLRWRALWPAAAVFGAVFLLGTCPPIGVFMLGFGIGLLQATLLYKSGFRQPWPWVIASGIGWGTALPASGITGLILGVALAQDMTDVSLSVVMLIAGIGGLAYGVVTRWSIGCCDYNPPTPYQEASQIPRRKLYAAIDEGTDDLDTSN